MPDSPAYPSAFRQCRSCGASIVWLTTVDHRPLETTPVIPTDTDIGYVVMRDVHGKYFWVPSAHLPESPPMHLRVHFCEAWREKREQERIDALHVATGDLVIS